MCALALVSLGSLGPHLAHILQDHVHVTVEGLHSPEDLAIVPAIYQAKGVCLHCLGEKGERALVEGVLLRRVLLRVLSLGHL